MKQLEEENVLHQRNCEQLEEEKSHLEYSSFRITEDNVRLNEKNAELEDTIVQLQEQISKLSQANQDGVDESYLQAIRAQEEKAASSQLELSHALEEKSQLLQELFRVNQVDARESTWIWYIY